MNSKVKFIVSLGMFFGGSVVIILLFYPSYKEYKRNQKINDEIEQLSRQAWQLRKNNEELSEKIEYLKTDGYKEKVAKEKLNMQKPDEQVVVVKPSVSKVETEDIRETDDADEQKVEIDNKSPNYRKWINYFFENL